MAFVQSLNINLRDKQVGPRAVPIVADEARTFGMQTLFRQVGIYSHVGQLYEPRDPRRDAGFTLYYMGINLGALFYGKRRRRTVVLFDDGLRANTLAAATRCHELLASGHTPAAEYAAKCDRCSLISLCLPKLSQRQLASKFLDRQFTSALAADGPESDPDTLDDVS
jgi:hypothetical protein